MLYLVLPTVTSVNLSQRGWLVACGGVLRVAKSFSQRISLIEFVNAVKKLTSINTGGGWFNEGFCRIRIR